jgi:Ca-activated chloride channel family protein
MPRAFALLADVVSLALAAVLVAGITELPHTLNGGLLASASQHSAGPGDTSGPLTIRRQVEEVRLAFTVRERRGRLVDNLGRDDFLVLEDGLPVTTITSFVPCQEVPLRLVLMVDASESMRRGFADEQSSARQFLASSVRPGVDLASILVFAASPRMLASGESQLVTAALAQMQAGGQTALYDSVYAAAQALSNQEPQPVRRVIILLSDGEDNWSRHNLQDAIAIAQDADLAIYAITAHRRRLEYAGDRPLRQLAEATGGQAFVLRHFSEAATVFDKIAAELRAQYILSFRPMANTSGFHRVSISVRHKKSLIVRSRAGYFAVRE